MKIQKIEFNYAQHQSNDRKPVQKYLSLMIQNQSSTFFTNGELQDLQA